MAHLAVYSRYAIVVPGAGQIDIGNATTPTLITLDSSAPDVISGRVTLADNAEAVLFSTGTDSGTTISDFKAFICYVSVDMTLVFQGTADMDNSALKLKGGTFFHILSDDIKNYDSTLISRAADAQTETNITSFMVGNNSGSTGYAQFWVVR